MKNILLLIGILIIGIAIGAFSDNIYNDKNQSGEMREGNENTLPLTVMRSDCIFDGQEMTTGTDRTILNFKITNHTASTTYRIDDFGFYPGILNEYPINKIENLRVFEGTSLVWKTSSSPWVASTTSILVSPNESKSFSLKADILDTTTTTTSTINLRMALGKIGAKIVFNEGDLTWAGVFKEVEKRPLLLPDQNGIDDSLESAFFRFGR